MAFGLLQSACCSWDQQLRDLGGIVSQQSLCEPNRQQQANTHLVGEAAPGGVCCGTPLESSPMFVLGNPKRAPPASHVHPDARAQYSSARSRSASKSRSPERQVGIDEDDEDDEDDDEEVDVESIEYYLVAEDPVNAAPGRSEFTRRQSAPETRMPSAPEAARPRPPAAQHHETRRHTNNPITVTSFGISLLPPPPAKPEAKTHAEWKIQFGLSDMQEVRRKSLEDAKVRGMNKLLIPSMRQKTARTPTGSERVRGEQSRQKRDGLKKLKKIKESIAKLEEKMTKHKLIDQDAYFHQKMLLLKTNSTVMNKTHEQLIWKQKEYNQVLASLKKLDNVHKHEMRVFRRAESY